MRVIYNLCMSNSTTEKPRRKLTTMELSDPVRGALRRIKKLHGITQTAAVERGVTLLETNLKGAAR